MIIRNSIYYSKYCVHSQKLINMIKDAPFAKNFCYISVDADPQTRQRPDNFLFVLGIDKVPTMIVDDRKYVGKAALVWVSQALQQQQQRPARTTKQASPPERFSQMDYAIDAGYRNLAPMTFQPQADDQDNSQQSTSWQPNPAEGLDGGPLFTNVSGFSSGNPSDSSRYTNPDEPESKLKLVQEQRSKELSDLVNMPAPPGELPPPIETKRKQR